MTNGVFDIIHAGHAEHFEDCKKHCDYLIVLVNSDESVRGLGKGNNRPIITESDRALLLSRLEGVDFVASFDEHTADNALLLLVPDVYLKGEEQRAYLPEQGAIDQLGIEVIYTRPKRSSTTDLIRKIKSVGISDS